jgi:MoaA/NifB/PqqE/SkfB family radical SAM enzyme
MLFEIKILGRRPLKYVDVAYDYRCNLKCKHCFARNFATTRDGRKMTIKDHEKFAKEAMALGALDFCLQGGEPFLIYNDLKEMIKAYQPSRNFISVTTNAALATEERLREIKKLGVDLLVVSLDSGLAEEHENFRRGKNIYENIIKAIDTALRIGLNVVINTTVSRQTVRSKGFRRLIDFVEERGIYMNTVYAVPVGAWSGNKDVIMRPEDTAYLNRLRAAHSLLRRDMDANFGVRWGCGAVKEAIYLTAYGDILPCPFIHISLGNVLSEPLKTIRERGLQVPYFKKYHRVCLAAEDRDFMAKYAQYTRNRKKFPIKFSDVSEWWEQHNVS